MYTIFYLLYMYNRLHDRRRKGAIKKHFTLKSIQKNKKEMVKIFKSVKRIEINKYQFN